MFPRLYRFPDAPDSSGNPPAGAPPAGAPPAGAPPAGAPPTFVVPEVYRDKPWAKGIDAPEKLWTMLDGAQTLIGKRPAGVPAADAKPEEWNAFYDALGRPKTAAEYQFDGADKADPKFTPKIQEAFHKHGLSAAQAKGVYGDINAALQEFAKERGLADATQNTDFDALATKTFGAEKEKVLATGRALITKYASPQFAPLVAALPNEQLIVMASVLQGIHKDYIKEDVIIPGGQGGGAQTEDQIRAEARAIMMLPEYKNEFHPQHAATIEKLNAVYAKLPKK